MDPPSAKQCCHSRCRRRLFSRGYFSVWPLPSNGKSSSPSLQSNFRPENVVKAIIIKIMAMIMTSWWLLLFTGLPRGWYKDVDNTKATENGCIQWHSGLRRWTERTEITHTKKQRRRGKWYNTVHPGFQQCIYQEIRINVAERNTAQDKTTKFIFGLGMFYVP